MGVDSANHYLWHQLTRGSHMPNATDPVADVMQVCMNGHVVTVRLRGDPASARTHCDRCGAITMDSCPTCGWQMPGAAADVDLVPIGSLAAPSWCGICGAAFPWSRKPRPPAPALANLEGLLRRLPLVVRQLRWRQGEKTPFRIEDERDLEDLVRSLLPLYFDDIRPEGRTPTYSPRNRTDFLLSRDSIALTLKLVRGGLTSQQLTEQWKEDIAYYQQRGGCRLLVVGVYDPEGSLRDKQTWETMWSVREGELGVRGIIMT
jgi:hypothetical protein